MVSTAPVPHNPAPLPATRHPNLWPHNVQFQHPKENCTRAAPLNKRETKSRSLHTLLSYPGKKLDSPQPSQALQGLIPSPKSTGSNLPCLHSTFILIVTQLFPFPAQRMSKLKDHNPLHPHCRELEAHCVPTSLSTGMNCQDCPHLRLPQAEEFGLNVPQHVC